jgi:2-hydroxychromene-2-carboxylate isomerase
VRIVLSLIPTKGKEILTRNTNQAFDDGAFGLPWIVASNRKGEMEGFWGFDHLGQICEFMGLEKPRSGGWKSVL